MINYAARLGGSLISGYEMRLKFRRLWVQIPVQYTEWTFENIFIIKIVCLKCLFEKTKVNEKEAGDGKGRHVLCWLSYNMMQSVVFKCETVFYVKPPTTNLSKTCFKKIVPTPASFSFIFVFSNNHHYDFYNKYMWKNFHPIHGAVNRTHNLRNVSLFP